jgi:hypothetical protein
MHDKLCLLHANCQGDELETLLKASPFFSRQYRIVRRTNYMRESFRDAELAACSLFLYQHLGPDWGEVSSDSLLARLPVTAERLRIPNHFTRAYWPLCYHDGPIADFSDLLLDRLIDEGAPKSAILRVYLHGDLNSFINLKVSLEETIDKEREKEKGAPIKTLDHFLANWKKRMLFHTLNHPGRELLELTAQGILRVLDLPPLSARDLATVYAEDFPGYVNFMDLPIHPAVAAFYGLDLPGRGPCSMFSAVP